MHFGPAGAHDPGETDNFAFPHFKRNVFRRLPPRPRVLQREARMLEAKHRFAEFSRPTRIKLVERTPHKERPLLVAPLASGLFKLDRRKNARRIDAGVPLDRARDQQSVRR